ncbi:hypothetical protein V2J09_012576 [Rumex salicifolius]
MGAAVREFAVTVTAREVIASALPLQEHWLPLSNLDLLLPPLDVGVFFCYADDKKSTTTSFDDKVVELKRSLAESLVSFYAFAGEVVENTAREPEILCNNRGVEFVEASAMDMELRELDLYDPDRSATKLKCGGMVVGCTFDHRVADAYSANMFLVAWARTATSSAAVTIPSFRRSLLNPRHPLSSVEPAIDGLYVPYSALPPPPATTAAAMISRIYHLPAAHLSALQSLATEPTSQKPPSKLLTLSAYLWKLIAQHAKSTRNDAVSCKLGIVVDGRQRMGPSMASYFGNVLSVPFGRLGANELTKMPLSYVAETVGQFVAVAANKEHFMGLVDWVEARRPEPAVAKAYVEGDEAGPGFVVSSGQRFPVSEVDFGWGLPVFGSYHFPWGGSTGYVMPMPSPKGDGNGDWIVYMHLLESQLDFIEEKASHFFTPFALGHVMP